MTGIQIRSESAPKRCEICHKSAIADFELNSCNRCLPLARYHAANRDNPDYDRAEIERILAQPKSNSYLYKIPTALTLLGFIFSVTFLGDLSGMGFVGFILIGPVIGLLLGLAIVSIIILKNRFQEIAQPLTDAATQERLKAWKDRKESKIIKAVK